MKRALPLFVALLMVGCRGSGPGFGPGYGLQRIPPPGTGSIGTPVQPQAGAYYQTTPTGTPTTGAGWRTPQGQPAVVQPNSVAVRPTITTTTPTPNLTSGTGTLSTGGVSLAPNGGATGGTQFTTPVTTPTVTTPTITTQPQVTTPTIHHQPNFNTGASTGQQWRTPGTTVSNTTVVNGQPVVGQPVAMSAPVSVGQAIRQTLGLGSTQPGGQVYIHPTPGQPVIYQNGATPATFNGGTPTVTPAAAPATGTLPLRGMPVNDATSIRVPTGRYPYFAPAPQTNPQGPPAYTYPNQATPGVVIPATAVQPSATGTYNVAPAGWQSANTARGNNDDATLNAVPGDGQLPANYGPTPEQSAAVVASAQSNSLPHSADRYGRHSDYRWLRGELEYSHADQRWKLRYVPHDAPEGHVDEFGGSVELSGSAELDDFESGDFVMVTGNIVAGDSQKSADYAAVYQVERISRLD